MDLAPPQPPSRRPTPQKFYELSDRAKDVPTADLKVDFGTAPGAMARQGEDSECGAGSGLLHVPLVAFPLCLRGKANGPAFQGIL